MVAVDDLGEADIDPLREERVMLDQRARAAHEGVVLLVGEENDVGIAHRDRARRMQQRRVDRSDLKLDAACVHLLCQRHLGPVQTGRSHVNLNQVTPRPPRGRRPAQGVDDHLFLAGRLQQ
ncbi:hypothetical protein D3C85_1366470 [compost metagenome]